VPAAHALSIKRSEKDSVKYVLVLDDCSVVSGV
jgi:hypothetical protein